MFLQNISGFMVGREYEAPGDRQGRRQAGHGGGLLAVAKFTVIIGGSFGAGNYGMCGRAFDPRLLFMWPNARISVMGGDQAAEVLSLVGGERGDGDGGSEAERKARISERYAREGSPTTRRPAVGRRRHRSGWTRAGCWAWAWSWRPRRPDPEPARYGVFRM